MIKNSAKKRRASKRSGITLEHLALTDEQWSHIKRIEKNIPENARIQIGIALGSYQTKQGWSRTSLKTKRLVISAQNTAKKLERLLTELAGDSVYFKVSLPFNDQIDAERSAIERARLDLANLASTLTNARERFKVKRGRKSPKALEELIVYLMGICGSNGGRVLNRSIKKGSVTPHDPFVYACIDLLTPKIPRSRIDTQLKRVISRYHAGLKGGYDMAQRKYVDT